MSSSCKLKLNLSPWVGSSRRCETILICPPHRNPYFEESKRVLTKHDGVGFPHGAFYGFEESYSVWMGASAYCGSKCPLKAP
jgi:hypothetical protein